EGHPVGGVLEPGIVYGGDSVARAEDHIDECVRAMRLSQPVRIGQLCREARGAERGHDFVEVLTTHEYIEVLRAALDPRVVAQRMGAADEIEQRSLGQRRHGTHVGGAHWLIVRCGRVARAAGHAYCSEPDEVTLDR